MSCLYAKKSAQQERLVQLSDDNAFVDVEAALKRMGNDITLETSAQQRSTKASTLSSSFDVAGRASSIARKQVYASRGSRASEDALLNGARVPLTVSLQEQHKLYVASVRAAADMVAELNSSVSSSCADSDGENNVAICDGNGGRHIRGTKLSAQQRKNARLPRSRVVRSVVDSSASVSSTTAPVVAMSDSAVAVSVRTVKKESTGDTFAPSTRTRKRSREKEGEVGSSIKGEKHDMRDVVMQVQVRGRIHLDANCEVNEVENSTAVSCALVARLNAQLRLVEQWRRAVLDHPSQIINGVLSPEPYAPWAATSVTEADVIDKGKKKSNSSNSNDTNIKKGAEELLNTVACFDFGEAEESVLPYPLLQLYTLCPSYDAVTAAPVSRRCVEHVIDEDNGDGKEIELRAALATLMSSSSSLSRLVKRTSSSASSAVLMQSVEVARVCFSFPIARLRRGISEKVLSLLYRPAGLIDYKNVGNTTTGGSMNGDGVQGAHQHHLCSVCMLPASYRCVRCRVALFCSIECHVLHDATRCLKFTV